MSVKTTLKPPAPTEETFEANGWHFKARKGHIMRSECYQKPPENSAGEGFMCGECNFCIYSRELIRLPHWPEMIFSDNQFTITHTASGATIDMNCLDALKLVDCEKDWVKVFACAEWREARKECRFINNTVKPYDWTYATHYQGTNQRFKMEETSEEINLEKLKVQEPIQFYQDIPLFEDELADNGVSEMSLRFRAMPSGWFGLLRQFIRVDGVLIQIRDTRLRWEAGWPDSKILGEYSIREKMINDLPDQARELICAHRNPNELMPYLDLKQRKLYQLVL